ncbi:MAG: DNA-binding protein [Oscillospiraceae bacterium]|nr:DNA-binding protein [Oscillospiraceae bacterium]
MVKDFEVSNLLDFYKNMLTEKQIEATECYYNEDLSLSEIATNQGITRQGVRDAIKRAEGQLFDMENKLGFAQKFREIIKGLEKISSEALRIKIINENLFFSKEIKDCTKRIEDIVSEISR